MLVRMEPLQSGRDTEIDMIEREMEGGVVVIQPLDVPEHRGEEDLSVRRRPKGSRVSRG